MFVVVQHMKNETKTVAVAPDRVTAINKAMAILEDIFLEHYPESRGLDKSNFLPKLEYPYKEEREILNYMHNGEYLLEHPIEIREVPFLGQGFPPLRESAFNVILFNALADNEIVNHDEFASRFGIDYRRPSTTDNVNVRVLVNGVDVDFGKHMVETLGKMLGHYDQDVADKARKLIREKSEAISELLRTMEDYHDGLDTCLRRLDDEAAAQYGK